MRWYYWLIVVICALLSMFFSAADMVYGMVDKDRLQREKGKKEKRAKAALKIADDYELSISAILLGNNIVNVAAASIVTLIAIALSYGKNIELAETISTIILTIFIIIFCEFIPKAFAKRFNYSLALLFAYPVTFFKYLFFIIVWPIAKLFKLFGKLFAKKSKEEDQIDEDVLTEMADSLEEEGILEENEAELLRSAIDLNDIEAFEIMTPRVDVYAISKDEDIDELIKDKEFFKHSRVPVYDETIDNIIGILPIKALAKKILAGDKDIDIKSLCYKPLIVPRNHQILDVLKEFKEKKVHVAVVIDEYGGTEGIITMEDILEEIVGDIFDEFDEIEEEYVEKGNSTYIVDGSMNIDDFFELIGYEEEVETDYTTVGGFCQDILDRFAKVGDEFDFAHYHFKVLEADEFTVEKLKVVDTEFEKD
ncbi:MAG: HlyC/CorC family transporter [Bacilli bacterium]|nr:HlyC/CorC family transporter [Bacilli bacterium]